MRYLLVLLLMALGYSASSQVADTTWYNVNVLPKYYVDTGTLLPAATFYDEAGRPHTLADYKGKIVYVNHWSTACGNSLEGIEYMHQLVKRLKVLQLDTAIVFVNIDAEDTKRDWKKALRQYRPPGVNLYTDDTALYTRWKIDPLPFYALLDTSGVLLGRYIASPQDASIDWILYSAIKGVHPVPAIKRMAYQNQLMAEARSPAAITDPEYAAWFAATIRSKVEHSTWRQERQRSAKR